MSLTATHKEEAERKLKEMAEEQNNEKLIKDKVKNVSKRINDKLKELLESDPKTANSSLSSFNSQYLSIFLTNLETKYQALVESEEDLKSEKQKCKINKDKINIIQNKVRYENSIKEIKETIVKIQKAIDESVAEEKAKRKKIQDDLDVSINEIKEKIKTFQKESEELEAQNVIMRVKKEQILGKISGLEGNFKKKAEEKDDSVKKEKQDLLEELRKVEDQVNEVTELNKHFAGVEKKNFDNKLSIYLRTKKFPELINSFQNSANTIDKCKNELTRGVQRLTKAIETTKTAEAKSKSLNDDFIAKLKVQTEKEEAIKKVKSEKEQIRARIIELQNLKKQKKTESEAKQE